MRPELRPPGPTLLDETELHSRRPGNLRCAACGRPWPCVPFKRGLRLDTPADRARAVLRMAAEARLAYQEGCRTAPPALVARFLWWVRLGRVEAQALADDLWPRDA